MKKTGSAFEADLLCLDAEIGFNQVEKIKVVASLETAFVGFAIHSQMVKTIIVAT